MTRTIITAERYRNHCRRLHSLNLKKRALEIRECRLLLEINDHLDWVRLMAKQQLTFLAKQIAMVVLCQWLNTRGKSTRYWHTAGTPSEAMLTHAATLSTADPRAMALVCRAHRLMEHAL